MDVLVSGASGLIGTALGRTLTTAGHRVLRLRRNANTSGGDIGWDPELGLIDAPALEGVDAVVHLAGEGIGEKRWTDEQKQRILESRTRGTSLLAETVAKLEPRPATMVSASAVGYYGNRGDVWLDETSPPGSGFTADVCVAW